MKSKKEEIVDAFIKHLIAISGAPGKILSDNGGEFYNDLFRELGEQFNTRPQLNPHGQMALLNVTMQSWEKWFINYC